MNPNILPDIELQLEGKLQFLKSMTVVDHIESLIFGMALHSSEAEVVIQLSATQMMKIIQILPVSTRRQVIDAQVYLNFFVTWAVSVESE